jgi:hypothetical protein
MAKTPRYVKTLVPFAKGKVPIYAGTRVSGALKTLGEMNVFDGVKMLELIEAAYVQGKKDGARDVSKSFEKMMKAIPHQNPGRPNKK